MANVAMYEAGSNKVSGEGSGDRADKGLRSKFRDYNLKANKDIPENELDRKLVEIEEKRRQSLVIWHQNVMKLHQELWKMSEELEESLVREEDDDTPERIKRSLQNTKPISEMSEEEINRLPILMRPRPKYPPHKYMFMSKRELRDINDTNFEYTMQRLKNDRLIRSETTLDGTTSRGTNRFPSLRTPQYYNILLNPRKHKKSELGDILERAKTMPCVGLEEQGNEDKNVRVEVNDSEEQKVNGDAEESGDAVTKARRNRSPRKISSGSVTSGSGLRRSSPGIARVTSGSVSAREQASPTKGMGSKSQSFPDLRFVGKDGVQIITNSTEKIEIGENEQENDLTDIQEETKSKAKKNKQKYLKSDKLDDLTDKQFRNKLIMHYAKQREDRNALSTLETLGNSERKSLLKIKMADIVTTSQRHVNQNKILKRLRDRNRTDDQGVHEHGDVVDENNTKTDGLPVITTNSAGMNAHSVYSPKKSERVELPTISAQKTQSSFLMPTVTSKPLDQRKQSRTSFSSFNKNNNNGHNEEYDALFNEDTVNNIDHMSIEQTKDTMEEIEKALSIIEEDEADEDIFDENVKECKYLRGYDPPQSRPIDNVTEYLFSGEEEPKLKNVTFYHPSILERSKSIIESTEEINTEND